ncbi:MAG: hypothetical protein ACXW3C_14805 [Pyrinomonadaceae bacterium]
MKRNLAFLFVLAMLGLTGACSQTANNNVVETNANVGNLNANNAPANTGVVVNNNGNQNTSGVRPVNANANGNHNK